MNYLRVAATDWLCKQFALNGTTGSLILLCECSKYSAVVVLAGLDNRARGSEVLPAPSPSMEGVIELPWSSSSADGCDCCWLAT